MSCGGLHSQTLEWQLMKGYLVLRPLNEAILKKIYKINHMIQQNNLYIVINEHIVDLMNRWMKRIILSIKRNKYIQWAPFIVITDTVINRVMLSHLWIPIRTNTTTCGKFCLMWSCIRFVLSFFFTFMTFVFPRNFILPLSLYPSLEVMVHSSAKPVHGDGICWRETCQPGEGGGGIPATLSLLHNRTHPHLTQFIYQFCLGKS